MQTDSFLTDDDRPRIASWIARDGKDGPTLPRVARELARLEQENQRIFRLYTEARVGLLDVESSNKQLRVESDAIKASMFSVLNALQLGDHVRPQSWSEVVSDEIVPAIERLQTRVDTLDCAHKLALADANTTRAALDAARAEVQRLRAELEKPVPDPLANLRESERKALRDACDQLDAMRREHQRLCAEAEKDQAARDEWQQTIDRLEDENARLRQNLRLSLILSEPGQADRVLERIATLEGRVQGITEIVKQELAIVVKRVQALEELVNRPSLVQEVIVQSPVQYVKTWTADAQPARNPFEDLRPPRGL